MEAQDVRRPGEVNSQPFQLRIDRSPIYDLPPHLLSLKDLVARQYKLRLGIDDAFSNEKIGLSVEEIAKAQRDALNARAVMDAGEQAVGLDDTQFRQFQAQLIAKLNEENELREPELQPISREQGIAAALGSALFPRFAFDIGATPFAANLQERERQRQLAQMEFQTREQRRAQALSVLAGQQQAEGELAYQQAALAQAAAARQDNERWRTIDHAFRTGVQTFQENAERWRQQFSERQYGDEKARLDAAEARVATEFPIRMELLKGEVERLPILKAMSEAQFQMLAKELVWFDHDKVLQAARIKAEMDQGWARVGQGDWGLELQEKGLRMNALQTVLSTHEKGASFIADQIDDAKVQAENRLTIMADPKTREMDKRQAQKEYDIYVEQIERLMGQYETIAGRIDSVRSLIQDIGNNVIQGDGGRPEGSTRMDEIESAFRKLFPDVQVQRYSGKPRNIEGTSTPSQHNAGLALDLFGTSNAQRTAIANWAIKQAGVQAVIYDGRIWSAKTGKWGAYNGKNPHKDHVHIEMPRPSSSTRPGIIQGKRTGAIIELGDG